MKNFVQKYPLLLIFLLGFGLRAGTAVGLQFYLDQQTDRQFLIEGDANGYWELGQKISSGEPYALHDPPRYVLRMPGFPVVLAFAIKMGSGSFLFARLLLALIGSISVLLTYQLAKRFFPDHIALWSALGIAVYPMMIGYSVLILSETCFSAAMLMSLWSLDLLRTNSNRSILRYSLFAGLTAALAVYMRPAWILFPVLFGAVWYCQSRLHKNCLIATGISLLVMFLCLTPWAWRNQQLTGHWVFTTLWSGPSLYDGLHAGATGKSDMRFFDEDRLWETRSEYEINHHYRNEAIQFLAENPSESVQLAIAKQAQFWRSWLSAEEVSRLWLSWILSPCFLTLSVLAVYGTWRVRSRPWCLFFLLGPLFYFAAIHLFFVGSPRYRLPAEYPLMILAAYGMSLLFKQSEITEKTGTK